MSEKLFLIDGSALYYRSYFALIRNPLINSKGENTSATFGFLSSLLKLIEEEQPSHLAVIFDTKEKTFRHDLYSDYKATRDKMPEDMAAQFPRIVETLKAFNFTLLDLPGYEADDIIGTLCSKYAGEVLDVYIVSGDKDMAQLVNDYVFLYTAGKANLPADIIDSSAVKEKFGVNPNQIIDWLTLMGDSSDNIPGAQKVGKKTAAKLLDEYGTMENVYHNLKLIKSDILRNNLENFREQSTLSKQLTTIDLNSPIDADLDHLKFKIWDMDIVDAVLRDLEFRRFYDRMLLIAKSHGQSAELPAQDKAKSCSYHLVKTKSDLDELVQKLKQQSSFVFDLETDSLDTKVARIAGIAIAWEAENAYYIPVHHQDAEMSEDEVIKRIRDIFEDESIKKVGHNIKYDAAVFKSNNLEVRGLYFDTMIASYLIDPSGRQHSLDRLAQEHLNHSMIPIENIIGSGKKQKLMTDLPSSDVLNYAAEDAEYTLKLMNIFADQLSENDLKSLFNDLEMPLVEVLMQMEDNGVKLDLDLLKELSGQLGKNLEELEQSIFKESGTSFNISSPQQLGKILFDEMEIHKSLGKRKPRKTKTGQYSTSESVLERYEEHPLIEKILTFRQHTKLKSTYVDALPALVSEVTGKIHTSYNQTVAATGRLSSTNPNLQNIPIRTELGREIRKAFVASQDEYIILSADYSQIELRIMAHLSGDKKLIEAFKHNMDIHASTASLIFNESLNEIDEDQRRRAKAINFGIMYGMNEYGLSNRLHISVEEARLFIQEYFATYPSIQDFMQKTIQHALEHGYVETMLKRRRYLPEINSSNRQVREFGERTAINTPIQGSAADLIKKAMIDIHNFMNTENPSAMMLLQVHDELVFEVHKNEADEFEKVIRDIMEKAIPLNVPVIVDTGRGLNWLEAH